MRARTAALVAGVAVLGACSGGGHPARETGGTAVLPPPPPVSTPTPGPVSSVPAGVTTTTVATPATTLDPTGSVTVHASGMSLPSTAAGAVGYRLLVHPTAPQLTVRRRGGGGAVTACPTADATAPARVSACAELTADRPVELAGAGVEIGARGAEAAVDEVSVTYLPADRSVTVVTPPRGPGACRARPCDAAFSLTPAPGGATGLKIVGTGARARLTLSSNNPVSGSIRTLATVEGGGDLSITATLDPNAVATLAVREEGADATGGLAVKILWP